MATTLPNQYPSFKEVMSTADTTPGFRTIEWFIVDPEESTSIEYKRVEATRTFDEHGIVDVYYADFAGDETPLIDIKRDEIDNDCISYSYTHYEDDSRCNGEIKITHDNRLQYFHCHDMFNDCFWVEPSLIFSLITGVSLTHELKTADYKHIKD